MFFPDNNDKVKLRHALEAEAMPIPEKKLLDRLFYKKDCNDRMSGKACYLNPQINGLREWPFP